MILILFNYELELCKELYLSDIKIQDYLKKHFSDSRIFSLDDLFDIRYGLLEQRYKDEVENLAGSRVVFIRPSMIRELDSTLMITTDKGGLPRLGERARLKSIFSADEIPFSKKHVLKRTDLLLNSKGENNFVDLSKGDWDPNHIYVASHHFIVLSVKSNILDHLGIDFTYVTQTLRFVLQAELKKKYNDIKVNIEKTDKEEDLSRVLNLVGIDSNRMNKNKSSLGSSRRSFFSMHPALKIEDLKSKRIAIPVNKESQTAIIDKYYRLADFKRSVEASLVLWEQNFSSVNKGELL